MLARWQPRHFPDAALAVVPATTGASTPVWRVEATWPERGMEVFFLRLGESPGERRDGEVRIHQLLTAQGIPVPEVVIWEGSPPELDRAATLTRAIPGTPIQELMLAMPPRDIAAIARAAGRDLARINRIPVDGYGWAGFILPDAATGTLRAEQPTREAWLADYRAALDTVVASGLIPDLAMSALQERVARWLSHAPGKMAQSVLAHGDFDVSHIFCTPPGEGSGPTPLPYTYTGIIDFGEARGADPLYDLGHALLHDATAGEQAIFPALLEGYRSVHPLSADAEDAIADQAIAIGVRRLAIAHRRESPYANVLAARIVQLIDSKTDGRPSLSHQPTLG